MQKKNLHLGQKLLYLHISVLEFEKSLPYSGLAKLHTWFQSGVFGRAKSLSRADFSPVHFFPCKKKKNIRSTILQANRSINQKVTLNSKYYHEHQRT